MIGNFLSISSGLIMMVMNLLDLCVTIVSIASLQKVRAFFSYWKFAYNKTKIDFNLIPQNISLYGGR